MQTSNMGFNNLNLIFTVLGILWNIVQCMEIGNKIQEDIWPFTNETALPDICPSPCLDENHPCTCYSDGWIDCNGKNLTDIPVLPSCSRLIDLQGNKISKINPADFSKTKDAQIINLSYNNITELKAGIFIQLRALKALTLHRNYIVHISDCAFHGLTALTSLDLSSNGITSIPTNAFDNNKELREITLYQNELSNLSPRWFQNKTSLETVALGSNDWNCSCGFQKSYKEILATTKLQVDCQDDVDTIFSSMCVQCSFPRYLFNLTLHNISEANFSHCDVNTTKSYENSSLPEVSKCESIITKNKFNNSTTAPRTTQPTYTNATIAALPETTTIQMTNATIAALPETTTLQTTNAIRNTTGTTTSKYPTKQPRPRESAMDTWVIILIIIVVLILIGFLIASIWCNNLNRRRLLRRKSYGTEETAI